MGTTVQVEAPLQGGTRKTVSEGGVRFETKLARQTMGATYANPGGDTITVPDPPPGGTLWCVEIMHYDRIAGMSIHWDGSTTTPKLVAFDEDNTSGIEAELANSSAALAAVDVYLRFIYKIGA